MAETTGISWTTSSWNPWIGCTRVSPGCDHCYAEALDARYKWGDHKAHWGAGVPRYRTAASNWAKPLAWNEKAWKSGKRWTVFPSLCDPFDNEVPEEWRTDLLDLINKTPNLAWLLLTKRIGNAARMMARYAWQQPFVNVWLGASVVNQEEADRDIPKLLATPAAKRFVSYEPALGPIEWDHLWTDGEAGLDWIIVGGESAQGSAKARPFDLAWARSTVAQCRDAGVPCFVKQLGSNPFDRADENAGRLVKLAKDRAGADPAEWTEDLRVQETPA